ncbi:hypothetical protein Hdeb2414_s0002g00056731 [Helianthus debilis subsp. tardiflorus]
MWPTTASEPRRKTAARSEFQSGGGGGHPVLDSALNRLGLSSLQNKSQVIRLGLDGSGHGFGSHFRFRFGQQ